MERSNREYDILSRANKKYSSSKKDNELEYGLEKSRIHSKYLADISLVKQRYMTRLREIEAEWAEAHRKFDEQP